MTTGMDLLKLRERAEDQDGLVREERAKQLQRDRHAADVGRILGGLRGNNRGNYGIGGSSELVSMRVSRRNVNPACEKFHGNMWHRAVPTGCVVDLPRLGFGKGDQLLYRFRRYRGMDEKQERIGDQQGYVCGGWADAVARKADVTSAMPMKRHRNQPMAAQGLRGHTAIRNEVMDALRVGAVILVVIID